MILTIYKTLDRFTPDLNALIEDFDSWLIKNAEVTYTDDNFQYIKPALNVSIKISADQLSLMPNQAIGNYVRFIEAGNNGEKHTTYYFITGSRWAAQRTVYLDLQMDTLNTFPDILNDIDEKTTVKRQHKDRFAKTDRLVKGQLTTLINLIDDQPEPVGDCPKYLETSKVIKGGTNYYVDQPWYLVYRTPANATSAQAVDCLLVPQEAVPLGTGRASYSVDDFSTENTYYILSSEYPSASVTVDGRTFSLADGTYSYICFGRTEHTAGRPDLITAAVIKSTTFGLDVESGSSITINGAASGWTLPVSYINAPYDTAKVQEQGTKWNIATSASEWFYSSSIDNIDRTDVRLLKIIQCPYCPIELSWKNNTIILPEGWGLKEGSIAVTNPNKVSFLKKLAEENSEPWETSYGVPNKQEIIRSIEDPKLRNSAFYQYKYIYDSYAVEVPLERIKFNYKTDGKPVLKVEYKQANTITSNCGFKVICDAASWDKTGDYDEYLLATRNNESPIYTNEYINYMRTGYNWDRKAQTQQNLSTWLGFGGQVGNLAGSMLGGAAIGRALGVGQIGGLVSGLTNSIISSIQAEDSIQRTIEEKKNQPTQVSGSDDLDLLNWYNGNKLCRYTYAVSKAVHDKLDDLFYYTGYAAGDVQEKPNFKSRVWFNFVQADISVGKASIYRDYIDDLATKFSDGVTVFHHYQNQWDIEQTMENFETWLAPN